MRQVESKSDLPNFIQNCMTKRDLLEALEVTDVDALDHVPPGVPVYR